MVKGKKARAMTAANAAGISLLAPRDAGSRKYAESLEMAGVDTMAGVDLESGGPGKGKGKGRKRKGKGKGKTLRRSERTLDPDYDVIKDALTREEDNGDWMCYANGMMTNDAHKEEEKGMMETMWKKQMNPSDNAGISGPGRKGYALPSDSEDEFDDFGRADGFAATNEQSYADDRRIKFVVTPERYKKYQSKLAHCDEETEKRAVYDPMLFLRKSEKSNLRKLKAFDLIDQVVAQPIRSDVDEETGFSNAHFHVSTLLAELNRFGIFYQGIMDDVITFTLQSKVSVMIRGYRFNPEATDELADTQFIGRYVKRKDERSGTIVDYEDLGYFKADYVIYGLLPPPKNKRSVDNMTRQ